MASFAYETIASVKTRMWSDWLIIKNEYDAVKRGKRVPKLKGD